MRNEPVVKMSSKERLARRDSQFKRLESMLEPEQAARLQAIPVRYRYLWLKAVTGNTSKTDAIKAKCQDCSGWEEVPISITDCTVTTCPIWRHRPYQLRECL